MRSISDSLKFTYRDYQLTPEDRRYELIDGDLLMTPSPTPFHQIVSQRVEMALALFVEQRRLGIVLYAPCDVYLSNHDVVQPDILYIAAERLGIIQEKNIQGAPDLVVEVLSPATRERDLELKLRLYARHGVREYWLVDLEARGIDVLARRQGKLQRVQGYVADEELVSPLLEGFRLPLGPVFAKILPL